MIVISISNWLFFRRVVVDAFVSFILIPSLLVAFYIMYFIGEIRIEFLSRFSPIHIAVSSIVLFMRMACGAMLLRHAVATFRT